MVNKCSLHPTDASIILTYRCPMKCKMCNIWFNPTNKSEEIKASDLKSLPKLKFINLTGGEPFIREDLPEIVEECYKHTDRIVISTSGWFEDRVIALAKQFPIIGIRISIEGLSCKNDELRGHAGGFDKGLRTLLALKEMGLKDIGFGCTVSNNNSRICFHCISSASHWEWNLLQPPFITRTTFIRTTMSSPTRTRCAVTLSN